MSNDFEIELDNLGVLPNQEPPHEYRLTTEYIYSNLRLPPGSRKIRLLYINPDESGNKNESPLKCNMCVVDLADSPKFHALSYVWGEKTPGNTISCSFPGGDATRIEITQNCLAALKQVRKNFGAVTIWVDAICINQNDDVEKAGQIPLMGEIYSWAHSVYVWLGPASKLSNNAMDLLTTRASFGRTISISYTADSSTEDGIKRTLGLLRKAYTNFSARLTPGVLVQYLYFPNFSNHIIDIEIPKSSLQDVLNREWVRRAWTFQEVLLARNPIFICGDKILSLEDMIFAFYYSSAFPLNGALSHKSETQSLKKLISSWESIINLWLDLPRPYRWNDKELRRKIPDMPDNGSFKRYLKLALDENALERRFKPYCITLVMFLLISVCSLMGFLTYKAGKDMQSHTPFSRDFVQIFLWILFIIGWVIVLGLLFMALGLPAIGSYHLMLGLPRGGLRLKLEEQSAKVQVDELTGIVTALRERAATQPQDKLFALLGILRAFGVATSAPNYGQPLGKTSWLFFKDLLHWKPGIVSMLAIAGGDASGDGSSWTPNWESPPQPWLTSRFLPEVLCRGSNSRLKVLGNKLVIKGARKGHVSFRVHLRHIENYDLDSSVNSLMSVWAWTNHIPTKPVVSAAYHSPVYSIFAILKGLTPQRRPQTQMISPPDTSYSRPGLSVRRSSHRPRMTGPPLRFGTPLRRPQYMGLPRYVGPYDFSQHREDFHAFRELYEKMNKIFLEASGGNNVKTHVTAYEQVGSHLLQDEEALSSWTRIVNGIVKDCRCLFVLSTGFAGSGPLDMEDNDSVCCFKGVPAPMVLRPVEDRDQEAKLRVVGPCLIHGLMYDSELDWNNREEVILI